MPNRNGTGPNGEGSLTGRGLGSCGRSMQNIQSEYGVQRLHKGFGSCGRRQGGQGCGRGLGNGQGCRQGRKRNSEGL